MSRRLVASWLPLVVATAACASRLPHPPYVEHKTDDLVAVDSDPPPARAEAVPARPQDDAMWIDGEWTWRGRRWAWKPGRWVAAPPGATFAPWTSVRDESGRLYFAPGTWHDASGAVIDAPATLAVATANPGTVFDQGGVALRTGPIVDRERTRRDAAAEDAGVDEDAGEGGAP